MTTTSISWPHYHVSFRNRNNTKHDLRTNYKRKLTHKSQFNKNHRHDEEHEQRCDAKRTKMCEENRFQSYFPEREGNLVKWYVDGRDYFWAVSMALEQAKESIYITDWWLSPELFLRRPPHATQEYRLDKLIKRKAEEGVQIYVSIYKEVEQALTCNSAHSKHALRRYATHVVL